MDMKLIKPEIFNYTMHRARKHTIYDIFVERKSKDRRTTDMLTF